MTLNGKLEDTPHDSRRFLVDQPVVFYFGCISIHYNGLEDMGVGCWILTRSPKQYFVVEDDPKELAVPAIGTGDVLSAFPYAPALSGEIGGRRLNLLLKT